MLEFKHNRVIEPTIINLNIQVAIKIAVLVALSKQDQKTFPLENTNQHLHVKHVA